MPRAFCLVLGTRGDAQPAALVAAALAARDGWTLTLFTHAAHQVWLAAPLHSSGVAAVWLNAPPAACWQPGSQVDAGRKRRRVAGCGRELTGLGPYREELIQCVETAIGRSFPLPVQLDDRRGLPDIVMANFMCLEGYHLAEAMGSALVMISPTQVPYGCPASFERRFSSAFPDLYTQLTTAGSDRKHPTHLMGSDAPGSPTGGTAPKGPPDGRGECEEGQSIRNAAPDAICWTDVEHWMWPLFLETWGAWRATRLGLPPLPCTDHAGEHLVPSPPAPLLLYGAMDSHDPLAVTLRPLLHSLPTYMCFSELVVPLPGYWPPHFRACGFWTPQHGESAWEGPTAAATECTAPMGLLLRDALQAPGRRSGADGTPLPLLLVDFGSMGRIGLIPSPRTFVIALDSVIRELGLSAIVLSGGWTPMEDACRAVEASTTESDGGRLCCLPAFPHHRLLPSCTAVLHHGGAGTTAAALAAGCSQIICPFQYDQFFWAERMEWLGLAPQPLRAAVLVGDGVSGMECEQSGLETAKAALRRAVEFVMLPSTQKEAKQMGDSLRAHDRQDRPGNSALLAADYVESYLQSSYGMFKRSTGVRSGADLMSGNQPCSSALGIKRGAEQGRREERNTLQLACLPAEIRLQCFGLNETKEICREVIDEACYLRHGLSVGPGDVVMDIGANVGLFIVFLLTGGMNRDSTSSESVSVQGWRGAPTRILAVEAVPPIADVLCGNVHQLVDRGIAPSTRIECVRSAVSDVTEGGRVKQFVFFPHMAGNSTGKPAEKVNQYAQMNASLRDVAFSGQQRHTCNVTTVDALMAEYKLARLDLLKVDVEGMELEVMQGIADETWPKIRQVVAEVHNVDGRLKKVLEVLQHKGGFNHVALNPDALRQCKQYNQESGNSSYGAPPDGNFLVFASRQKN